MSRTTFAAEVMCALAIAGTALTPVGVRDLSAQHAGQVAHYQPVTWPAEVSGKNFPLFAILDADESARTALAAAPALRSILESRNKAVARATTECGADASCHAAAFSWSEQDIAAVREALSTVAKDGSLRSAIATMRSTGLFARDAAVDDDAFVARSWERAAEGLNNILAVYGKGQKPRYPDIDAVSYGAASASYGQVVHTAVRLMNEEAGRWELFYQPALAMALRLLDINWRDEAGRHEPLHLDANAAAYRRVSTVKWADYPYTVALVPGAGLSEEMERDNHGLNPMGKLIIEIAARRYFDKKVAFIVVSGGYVHPKHTRFAEAIEMKRSLMRDFNVPEDAIIIDPHARHTTTNVRNAARLLFRYGIPTDRLALITTQQYHLDSIAAAAFDERNDRELGYRPYLSKRRLSPFELEWTPNVMSLHADPLDPLDP